MSEKNFVLEALKQKLRIDGRDFESFRGLELSFGEDYGLADVQLGKTRWVSFSGLYETGDTDSALEFPGCLLESPPRSQSHSRTVPSMVFSKSLPSWVPWHLPHSRQAGLSPAPRLPL